MKYPDRDGDGEWYDSAKGAVLNGMNLAAQKFKVALLCRYVPKPTDVKWFDVRRYEIRPTSESDYERGGKSLTGLKFSRRKAEIKARMLTWKRLDMRPFTLHKKSPGWWDVLDPGTRRAVNRRALREHTARQLARDVGRELWCAVVYADSAPGKPLIGYWRIPCAWGGEYRIAWYGAIEQKRKGRRKLPGPGTLLRLT